MANGPMSWHVAKKPFAKWLIYQFIDAYTFITGLQKHQSPGMKDSHNAAKLQVCCHRFYWTDSSNILPDIISNIE